MLTLENEVTQKRKRGLEYLQKKKLGGTIQNRTSLENCYLWVESVVNIFRITESNHH